MSPRTGVNSVVCRFWLVALLALCVQGSRDYGAKLCNVVSWSTLVLALASVVAGRSEVVAVSVRLEMELKEEITDGLE